MKNSSKKKLFHSKSSQCWTMEWKKESWDFWSVHFFCFPSFLLFIKPSIDGFIHFPTKSLTSSTILETHILHPLSVSSIFPWTKQKWQKTQQESEHYQCSMTMIFEGKAETSASAKSVWFTTKGVTFSSGVFAFFFCFFPLGGGGGAGAGNPSEDDGTTESTADELGLTPRVELRVTRDGTGDAIVNDASAALRFLDAIAQNSGEATETNNSHQMACSWVNNTRVRRGILRGQLIIIFKFKININIYILTNYDMRCIKY